MKLIRLNIPSYRVLREIEIDFERNEERRIELFGSQRNYALDFFAGVNGTGKSTVLRLLGKLFAVLQSDSYAFPSPIELEYTIQDSGEEKKITVSNLKGDEYDPFAKYENLRHKVNDEEEWRREKIRLGLLPRQVVIYTTGSEREWIEDLESDDFIGSNLALETAEADENNRYLSELSGNRPKTQIDEQELDLDPDEPLLFVQADRMQLVALCGLLESRKNQADDRGETLANALNSIGLETLLGFSLRVRSQPELTSIKQQQVIDGLVKAADQVILSGADKLLVFNVDLQLQSGEKPSIFTTYSTSIELFKRLNFLYEHKPFYDPPLQQVSLFLKRQPNNPQLLPDDAALPASMLHLFEWLSDGEQSFLARMALLALFRGDNLLILLDEPEVHFNDVWKREIVNMLDQIMFGYSSHAVISTHSSITLSDVPPEDILVFRRQDQLVQGREAVRPPDFETFGAEPSDIMVHVFGTRFASGEHSVNHILREIGRRSSQGVNELLELEDRVAPGYWRYRIRLEAQRLQA